MISKNHPGRENPSPQGHTPKSKSEGKATPHQTKHNYLVQYICHDSPDREKTKPNDSDLLTAIS